MLKAFLDSSVIILGLETTDSNSALIIDMMIRKEIECFINDKVLKEVREYFRRRRNRNYAFIIEILLRKNCIVVRKEEFYGKIIEFKGKIKDKDLEQLACVKGIGIKYLVAYDRDFMPFEEYKIPKEFVKLLGIKPRDNEF